MQAHDSVEAAEAETDRGLASRRRSESLSALVGIRSPGVRHKSRVPTGCLRAAVTFWQPCPKILLVGVGTPYSRRRNSVQLEERSRLVRPTTPARPSCHREMRPMPTTLQGESSSAALGARLCTCGKPMFPSSSDRSFSFEYRSFECWACRRRQTFSISVDRYQQG
jgi:hypothetical protein